MLRQMHSLELITVEGVWGMNMRPHELCLAQVVLYSCSIQSSCEEV